MVLATEGPRVGHSEANRYRCRETRCTIVSVTRSLWQYTPATTIRLVIMPFGDAYYSAHDLPRLLCLQPDTESTSKVRVPWFLLKMIVPRSQGHNIFREDIIYSVALWSLCANVEEGQELWLPKIANCSRCRCFTFTNFAKLHGRRLRLRHRHTLTSPGSTNKQTQTYIDTLTSPSCKETNTAKR